MDVLSEVLKAVRLDGALFFNAEFTAPWCVTSSRSDELGPYLSSASGHIIIFHFLTEGQAYARLMDGGRVDLSAGDIVIFPHGDPHALGNGGSARPVDSMSAFGSVASGFRLVRHGGGGETTRFVCGYMACEPRLSEVFLAGLPKMFKVNITNEPSGQWIENSIRFSVAEAGTTNAGGAVVLAKLSELLFVETLRRYANALPPDQTGWLGGVRDPIIGQALALLHREPQRAWTISSLARQVGLSRTRLAERFRHFLGESPMAYLSQWRLKLGAEILQSTGDSVAEVAAAVGYGSESAFNRAFKREFSCPPAQFRRRHSVSTPNSAKGAIAIV